MSRPASVSSAAAKLLFGFSLLMFSTVCSAPRAWAHGEVAGGGAQTFVETVKGKQGRYRIEVMYSPSLPTAGEIANVEIKALRLLDVPDPLLGSEVPVGLPPEGSLLDSKTGQPAEAHLPVHPDRLVLVQHIELHIPK